MSLKEKDKQFLWHPFTQHKLESGFPLITKAEGAYLYDDAGNKIIDAISSWWTNTHGHCQPHIISAIQKQAAELDHVLFAGFTHAPAINLASRLVDKLPYNQGKIFFSDDGSTSVEVALKIAIQYWHNKGEKRNRVIAFTNAYHGDTFGAMSAGERTSFNLPFAEQLFHVDRVEVPLEGKMELRALEQMETLLEKHGKEIAAFIYEPLIQGSAGMIMYPASALDELLKLCKKHNILCIADEVMTGFGRTGKLFASEYMTVKPDMMCLSKGITGGALPLGVTSCTHEIYMAFYEEDRKKMFFHGHSFTANPIICAAALANMELFSEDETWNRIERISSAHDSFMEDLSGFAGDLRAYRKSGTVLALEFGKSGPTSYFNPVRDKAYAFFMSKGILLRPLGNVLYVMPPYCISESDLQYIYTSITEFINTIK
jgi:adenosylmethionine---8-amino-7-oxononanoate aminotransferase